MTNRKPCRTTGKVSYRNELEAKMALARRVWKDKGEKRIYRCNFCGSYHLTSKELNNAI